MLSISVRESIFSCLRVIEEDEKFIFERLRYLAMSSLSELNSDEINSILDLFIYGLENSKIINQEKWIDDNSSYFSGNCFLSGVWKHKFSTGDFTFYSLVDYMNLIKANLTRVNLDFSLRNVEVTLRDHVIYNDFNMYMDICRSVLNDILNGKAR